MKQILIIGEDAYQETNQCQRLSRIMLQQATPVVYRNVIKLTPDITDKVTTSITSNDEIFISEALVPYRGYGGDRVNVEIIKELFRKLEEKEVVNKKIHLFCDNSSVSWHRFDGRTFYSLFQKNHLYVTNSKKQEWEKMDTERLAEFEMNYEPITLPEVVVKAVVKKPVKKKK